MKINIAFTEECWNKTQALVKLAGKEVGWLGSVTRNETATSINFVINDIYIPKQEVTSTATEMSADGLFDMAERVGAENMVALRFWGHSHVGMGVSPSGQDDKTMEEEFATNGVEYMIRGIFNKGGEVDLSVYVYNTAVGVMSIDIDKYTILSTTDCPYKAQLAADLKAYVTERSYAVTGNWVPSYGRKQAVMPWADEMYNIHDMDDEYDEMRLLKSCYPDIDEADEAVTKALRVQRLDDMKLQLPAAYDDEYFLDFLDDYDVELGELDMPQIRAEFREYIEFYKNDYVMSKKYKRDLPDFGFDKVAEEEDGNEFKLHGVS